MKRGTPEHPKTRRLVRALGCGQAQAVGHLELLWHFTHDWAPQGNVGKWTDTEIADACGWEGDAAQFVAALRDSGWLDSSEPHRLIVHDWHEHAEKLTRNYLQYHGLPFLSLRKHSRRLSDNVGQSRPSRARAPVGTGTGNGTGSESSVLGGVPGEPLPLKRAVPFPDDFTLTAELQTFAEQGGLNARMEFGHFRDHHTAKGSTFKNWEAAFRTWCRRAVTFPHRQTGG